MSALARRVDRLHGVIVRGGDGQVDRKALVIPPGYFDVVDPFLMLAEDWFSTPGFDWHPHRGIETVTLVLDGALEHGDNQGNAGVLGPGDVQWMTAGGGIVHRELAHRDEHVHSLQLWVNLPSARKLVPARYQDFAAADLPAVAGAGTQVVTVAGPAAKHWPVAGMRVTVEPGRAVSLPLPAAHRAFLYVLSGRLAVGVAGTPMGAGDVAWSDPVSVAAADSVFDLVAPDGDVVVDAVLFSGRPIREPVVAYGPFVMNTEDEIRQAYADFRSGRFGRIPALARL